MSKKSLKNWCIKGVKGLISVLLAFGVSSCNKGCKSDPENTEASYELWGVAATEKILRDVNDEEYESVKKKRNSPWIRRKTNMSRHK